MREISVKNIEERIVSACESMAIEYNPDIVSALETAFAEEKGSRAKDALGMLLENAKIAKEERIPICQDTGMVIVWLKAGQDVHFTDGSLSEAIQRGVARGYTENYLRASVVDDPVFQRKNTKTNTPCVIYTEITEGEEVSIELMAKGFGSENKSRSVMLTPADGKEGIEKFVLETIQLAGPNACPPFVVGVGIGGTFDSCAVMSKHALLRPLNENHPDPVYAALERELTEKANALNIGPMGLHGKTTVLKVQIESAPTHIAGMPCAVNICCHVCRHAKVVI